MSDCENTFVWVSRLKKTYQPVEGFEDKIEPARIEGFKKILTTITDHCGGVRDKSFLDLGCNFGYFCLELAKLGARTFGVERDKRRSATSKCLAQKLGLDGAQFIKEDVLKYVEALNGEARFDYVILLNVFHHILVQDETRGWNMFNKLIDNSNGVFVMMRNNLKDWKLCDTRLGIPDAVVGASNATGYKEYPAVHGRVIYFFYAVNP